MKTRFAFHGAAYSIGWLLLTLCAAPCVADSDAAYNSIHAGAASFQFVTFGGTSRAPAFSTSGIYMKTHFSDRGAVRVGIDFSLNSNSVTRRDPPDYVSSVKYNTRNYSYNTSAEIQEYVDARGPVTIFFGLGPYWRKARTFNDETATVRPNNSGITYVSYRKAEQKAWEVGGAGSIGFEWFFRSKLSVLGRVGATFGFGKTQDTYHSHYDNVPNAPPPLNARTDANTATAGSSSAALGLAIYL